MDVALASDSINEGFYQHVTADCQRQKEGRKTEGKKDKVKSVNEQRRVQQKQNMRDCKAWYDGLN